MKALPAWFLAQALSEPATAEEEQSRNTPEIEAMNRRKRLEKVYHSD